MTTTRTATECKIYWDTQDPANEGWAYRVLFSDGHEESGAWEWDLPRQATIGQLQDAVVTLAYEHDIAIAAGDVAGDESVDGGYAEWIAE